MINYVCCLFTDPYAKIVMGPIHSTVKHPRTTSTKSRKLLSSKDAHYQQHQETTEWIQGVGTTEGGRFVKHTAASVDTDIDDDTATATDTGRSVSSGETTEDEATTESEKGYCLGLYMMRENQRNLTAKE